VQTQQRKGPAFGAFPHELTPELAIGLLLLLARLLLAAMLLAAMLLTGLLVGFLILLARICSFREPLFSTTWSNQGTRQLIAREHQFR
jgi:hypothetical protein